MTDGDPGQDETPAGQDPLVEAARRRGERHRRWRLGGEDSTPRRLAQIGVLGWMIVLPTLVGIFAGRWLDDRFATGLTWTGALLFVGLGLGCWSAWRWMMGE